MVRTLVITPFFGVFSGILEYSVRAHSVVLFSDKDYFKNYTKLLTLFQNITRFSFSTYIASYTLIYAISRYQEKT